MRPGINLFRNACGLHYAKSLYTVHIQMFNYVKRIVAQTKIRFGITHKGFGWYLAVRVYISNQVFFTLNIGDM